MVSSILTLHANTYGNIEYMKKKMMTKKTYFYLIVVGLLITVINLGVGIAAFLSVSIFLLIQKFSKD